MSVHPFHSPPNRRARKAKAAIAGNDHGQTQSKLTRSKNHNTPRDEAHSLIREIWPEGVTLRPSVAAILEGSFAEDLIIRTVAQLRADGMCSEDALVTVLFGRIGEAALRLNQVGQYGDYWHV